MRRTSMRLIAAFTASALLVVACGDDEESNGTTAGPAPRTTGHTTGATTGDTTEATPGRGEAPEKTAPAIAVHQRPRRSDKRDAAENRKLQRAVGRGALGSRCLGQNGLPDDDFDGRPSSVVSIRHL